VQSHLSNFWARRQSVACGLLALCIHLSCLPCGAQPPSQPPSQAAATPEVEDFFSGPQPGEPTPAFRVRLLEGPQQGQDADALELLSKDVRLLVFVHQVTRPSAALTRLIVDYAEKQHGDAIDTCVVFLNDDPSDVGNFVRRARHAIPQPTLLAATIDGIEGPGAYGLNRNAILTVLIAKEGQVTHNFALVQPSLTPDGTAIGAAIEAALGHEKQPTLSEMGYNEARGAAMRPQNPGDEVDDETFRGLLAPVIRKTATADEVKQAADRVEQRVATDPAFARRLQSTAQRIIEAGRLENYGTPTAQEYLKKWAEHGNASTPTSE
jgi:hypothetical protein